MRLLFDENLSPDLPRLLADVFPSSAHVREKNLVGSDDLMVWEFSAAHGYALVTKDDDFVELSILRGAPPKVILIGLGNCRTSDVVALLKKEQSKLKQFAEDAAAAIIELPLRAG